MPDIPGARAKLNGAKCNNNNFTVHLVKRVFNMSAILIHDTLQTTFPLSDVPINEAPWQCASLQHDRLLQLINGVKIPVVVDSLMYGPQMA